MNHIPVTRSGRTAWGALAAALWSSADADRMLAIVRPSDFPPPDDTVAAAIADQRRQGIEWSDPRTVYQALWDYRQLWRDRRDSGRFGRPAVDTPIRDLIDPDRWPLRFAGPVLQSGLVTDLLVHPPAADVTAAARDVAAARRAEVSAMTMQRIHRILSDTDDGVGRAERQQAVAEVLHRYRHDLHADHLYPQRRPVSRGAAVDGISR